MNSNLTNKKIFKFEDYLVDCQSKLLYQKDKILKTGNKEFDCLELLILNAGEIVTKEEFLKVIWNNPTIDDGVLAVNISNLRKILEKNPNEKNKYIQTISKIGYRFVFSVEEVNANAEKKSQILTNPATNKSENHWVGLRGKNLKILALAFSILIGAFLFYYFYLSKQTQNPPISNKKVAIFPFENATGNEQDDYLSLAFASAINNSFFDVHRIDILPLRLTKGFIGNKYDPVQEGLKLKIDAVVSGSFQIIGGKITVKVLVTEINQKKNIPQQREFVMNRTNMTDLQRNVISFIYDSLNLALPPEDEEILRQRETKNPEAFENFLRGTNAHIHNDLEKAAGLYQKAFDIDPDFGLAAEGLASAYFSLGNARGCGEKCILKSVEIYNHLLQKNPTNSRIKVSLAQTLIETNQVEKAVPQLKALLIDDSVKYAVYNALSYAYRYAGMLDESQAMYYKAQEQYFRALLIERSEIFYNNALLYKGNYNEFLQNLNSFPDAPVVGFYKGFANYHLKDFSRATNEFNAAYNLDRTAMITKIGKVYVYQIDNKLSEALILADEINQSLIDKKVYDGEMIYKVAQVYAVLNQKEKALSLFKLSVEKGFFNYPYFLNDPLMVNIKNMPEFVITLKQAQKRHNEFYESFIK